MIGDPDPRYISTSIIERQNLNIRMCLRRFTRLSNGFSKKLDNHKFALALYNMCYNFVKISWDPASPADNGSRSFRSRVDLRGGGWPLRMNAKHTPPILDSNAAICLD